MTETEMSRELQLSDREIGIVLRCLMDSANCLDSGVRNHESEFCEDCDRDRAKRIRAIRQKIQEWRQERKSK